MAKMKNKLSFKRDAKITGLAGIGNCNQGSAIKCDGAVVGDIHAPNWASKDNFYHVSLMVNHIPGPGENCDWKRITLKGDFESDAEAREFVKGKWIQILDKYDLYKMVD